MNNKKSFFIVYLFDYFNIGRLKEKREEAGPNVGFEHQLRLFETLKYTVDVTNLQYRMFRLRITANQVSKGKTGVQMPNLNNHITIYYRILLF